jgi:hypothetical protein
VTQHVALTYDRSSQTARLYLDGALVADEVVGSIVPATATPLYFGKRIAPVTGSGTVFKGLMDEVSLYARALGQVEIQSIVAASKSGKCAALIAPFIVAQPAGSTNAVGEPALLSVTAVGSSVLTYHWRRDGMPIIEETNPSLSFTSSKAGDSGTYSVIVSNSAGTVTSSNAVLSVRVPECSASSDGLVAWWRGDGATTDMIGGNTAVISNAVTYTSAKVGAGFVFDGTGFLEVPASPGTDIGAADGMTIECWINPATTAPMPLLEWKYTDVGGSAVGFQFWVGTQGAGTLFASMTESNGVVHPVSSPSGTIKANQYQHVALTYGKTNGMARLYIDGVEVASQNVGNIRPKTWSNLLIGRRLDGGNGWKYQGTMDEISLYVRALTAAEIQAIYAAGGLGKCVTPAPAVIIAQPKGSTNELGSDVELRVLAAGSSPLFYQWRHEGTNVFGGTNATLVLANAQFADAGSYSVVVSNHLGSVTSSNAAVAVVALPPYFVTQPANQTRTVGDTAAFSVVAGGAKPLGYQWFFNKTNAFTGGTNATLSVTNVGPSAVGDYTVVVANALGFATSAVARLTVNYPAALIGIAGSEAYAGSVVSVPVSIRANGNENSLSFSLTYTTARLQYAGVTLGSGAAEGTVLVNQSQTNVGRVGFAIALPLNTSFTHGTQQVVMVRFNSTLATSGGPVVTTVGFTTSPIEQRLTDTGAATLPRSFSPPAAVRLLPSPIEGDVFPRPTGNSILEVNDWMQAGRFVVGLDVPASAEEFQRIDTAPRATRGDGKLKVTDWVQAGRYVIGLDPITGIGGPTSLVSQTSSPLNDRSRVVQSSVRTLKAMNASAVQGLSLQIPILLEAQGDENAVGFSLGFDTNAFEYVSVAKGSAFGSGSSIQINAQDADMGRVGIVLALPTGNTLPAGSATIATATLRAKTSEPGNYGVTFIDWPLPTGVSDALANELEAVPAASTVTLNPPPTLTATKAAETVKLTWPTWVEGFGLQGGHLSGGGWTNVTAIKTTNGGMVEVILPLSGESAFFRLQHP